MNIHVAVVERGRRMILLRRGRHVQHASSVDIDMALALGPMPRRRRECATPWRPPVEVFETQRDLVVRTEIGGLSGDDVDVSVEDGELQIRGERPVPQVQEQRLYQESQIRYGRFDVRVRLPFPVNGASARADYIDGFLTVSLPRLEATRVAPRESVVPPVTGEGSEGR